MYNHRVIVEFLHSSGFPSRRDEAKFVESDVKKQFLPSHRNIAQFSAEMMYACRICSQLMPIGNGPGGADPIHN